MKNSTRLIRALSMAMLFLTGCSTWINGPMQTITLVTPEVEGASCTLTNEKGESWHLASTPGRVTIKRSIAPLSIICSKPGYKQAVEIINPHLTKAAMSNIFNAGIGGVVDFRKSTSHDYPPEITLWLEPKYWQSEFERQSWEGKKRLYEQQKYDKAHKCRFSNLTNC